MNISEDTFTNWSKGPGQTETSKCDNAVTAIRKAIDADERLLKLDVDVFPQGSYRARTNVRQDSDVDVCVCLRTNFLDEYPDGKRREDFGNRPGEINYSTFKDWVHEALVGYLGERSVVRGKKAFDIHENTYRLDADVLPAFEYRWYTGRLNPDQTHHFHKGIAFIPDGGNRVVNWPEQPMRTA